MRPVAANRRAAWPLAPPKGCRRAGKGACPGGAVMSAALPANRRGAGVYIRTVGGRPRGAISLERRKASGRRGSARAGEPASQPESGRGSGWADSIRRHPRPAASILQSSPRPASRRSLLLPASVAPPAQRPVVAATSHPSTIQCHPPPRPPRSAPGPALPDAAGLDESAEPDIAGFPTAARLPRPLHRRPPPPPSPAGFPGSGCRLGRHFPLPERRGRGRRRRRSHAVAPSQSSSPLPSPHGRCAPDSGPAAPGHPSKVGGFPEATEAPAAGAAPTRDRAGPPAAAAAGGMLQNVNPNGKYVIRRAPPGEGRGREGGGRRAGLGWAGRRAAGGPGWPGAIRFGWLRVRARRWRCSPPSRALRTRRSLATAAPCKKDLVSR